MIRSFHTRTGTHTHIHTEPQSHRATEPCNYAATQPHSQGKCHKATQHTAARPHSNTHSTHIHTRARTTHCHTQPYTLHNRTRCRPFAAPRDFVAPTTTRIKPPHTAQRKGCQPGGRGRRGPGRPNRLPCPGGDRVSARVSAPCRGSRPIQDHTGAAWKNAKGKPAQATRPLSRNTNNGAPQGGRRGRVPGFAPALWPRLARMPFGRPVPRHTPKRNATDIRRIPFKGAEHHARWFRHGTVKSTSPYPVGPARRLSRYDATVAALRGGRANRQRSMARGPIYDRRRSRLTTDGLGEPHRVGPRLTAACVLGRGTTIYVTCL